MMKTIEDYQNLVELLKQALLFYSKEDSYKSGKNNIALIDRDKGSQAQFALNKINEFQDDSKKLEEEFIKSMTNAIESNENQVTLLELIKTYKKNSE